MLDPRGPISVAERANPVRCDRHHARDRGPNDARHAWRRVLVSRFQQARQLLAQLPIFRSPRAARLVNPPHDRASCRLRRLDQFLRSRSAEPIASSAKPVKIEVVSLDWKWLFIYPDQGVASVNQLTIPAGAPVSFVLISSGVMNSFFVPQLAGQIDTMAGMVTHLNLQADSPGAYRGMSANFSGDGFADMYFEVDAVPPETFAHWVDLARSAGPALDAQAYTDLVKPSKARRAVHLQIDRSAACPHASSARDRSQMTMSVSAIAKPMRAER